MAVAGLHNISSAFGPSFFGDSRPATRASALLQMWRELENEHIMARSCGPRQNPKNGSDIECWSSENGSDDGSSFLSDDLSETERERVRQIFREWMNSGSKENRPQIKEDPQRLGTRPIRRLCGRQTLLDLVVMAQGEREREISVLNERRPVSEFAHRNRIQAHLRGRFLRNEKVVGDERPSSRGAAELGLLRQRHTVSDLREGFLSKLDKSSSFSSNSTISSNCVPESICPEKEDTQVQVMLDFPRGADEDMKIQEPEIRGTKANGHDSLIERSDQDMAHDSQLSSSQEDKSHDTVEEINFNISNNESPLEHLVIENYAADSIENTTEELDSREGSCRVEEDSVSAYQLNPGQFDNNVENEHERIQEPHENRLSNYLQEAIDSWLGIPSRIFDSFCPPDDDHARCVELRELFSRRRVSSLLRSSFGESLNQVLLAHVERIRRDSIHWIDQDHGQLLDGEHSNLSMSDTNERDQFDSSYDVFGGSHPLWGNGEFQGMNWSQDHPNVQLETEWEVINELRIDMARLQQRMNHMQSMLEDCMEMQIELQRSVSHELSTSLNRPMFPTVEDAYKDDRLLDDESRWDHVRKGICCLCKDRKIDSLLYRCGHICLCCNCAENLVRCKGKCPMCQAPAVETVQAYFASVTQH